MMSFWKERSSGDDHSAGDTLCSECSLVLESHSIDKTSEWRTFANESSNSDPNRVGGPTNPLLADSAFTTVIAKTNGSSGDFLSNSLGRWQNRNGSAELGLIQAFKTIATMSDRLGLVGTIKDRANEIFKRLEDQKSTRGRNQDVLWQPACTFPVDKRTSHELLRVKISLLRESLVPPLDIKSFAIISQSDSSTFVSRKFFLTQVAAKLQQASTLG